MLSRHCMSLIALASAYQASAQMVPDDNEENKDINIKRAMCKLVGDPTYVEAYAYGSRFFNPRETLDYNYGYLILEQDGEHGDLRVKYGKMWLMEKKKNENDIVDFGFQIMKYPHLHGDCTSFGHWNPQA